MQRQIARQVALSIRSGNTLGDMSLDRDRDHDRDRDRDRNRDRQGGGGGKALHFAGRVEQLMHTKQKEA